jgi:hypothetical protein
MARGWESKSVEEQQSLASSLPNDRKKRTAHQIEAQKHRDALMLSRSRILEQMESARNPEYRKMLEVALTDLDLQLARPD